MAKTPAPPNLDPVASMLPLGADNQKGTVTPVWLDWFTALVDAVDKPSCHVYFDDALSIATTATWQIVVWDQEEDDQFGMHSTSSNTDRITIPSAGVYAFGAHLLWASDNTGQRQLGITLNNTAIPPTESAFLVSDGRDAAIPNSNWNHASGLRRLSAGDILRCVAYQTSGGALNLNGTDTLGPRANGFWCFRVSK